LVSTDIPVASGAFSAAVATQNSAACRTPGDFGIPAIPLSAWSRIFPPVVAQNSERSRKSGDFRATAIPSWVWLRFFSAVVSLLSFRLRSRAGLELELVTLRLCLLKTPEGRESLEIFVPPPYCHGHGHNSFRARFPALVPYSLPRLTGAWARRTSAPSRRPAAATPWCPFRKSYPNVLVMQPSQDRNGDNGARSLDCSVQGRIFL